MIKKLFVLVSLLVLLLGGLNIKTVGADYAPKLEWMKTFGGAYDYSAYSVVQTNDRGYVITGHTGSDWIWLLKTDKDGNEEWSREFGQEENKMGVGYSVKQTTDDGFVIVGTAADDIWLIKTDVMGNLIWNKTFGGRYWGEGHSVQQTNDGGYIILGDIDSEDGQAIWLIKTDANGNEKWNKTFGGMDWDDGYNVQQTSDDGYILVGRKGLTDGIIWLIKTDENGNEKWNKTFGNFEGYSVKQTADGGYVVAGVFSKLGNHNADIVLIKTDASGNEIWYKKIGGNFNDGAYSVQNTIDGGYIISGGTTSYGNGDEGAWLIKTDANGDMVWDRIFYDVSGIPGENIQQTTDGGYIFVGIMYNNVLNNHTCLIKIPPGEYSSDSKTMGAYTKGLSGIQLIGDIYLIIAFLVVIILIIMQFRIYKIIKTKYPNKFVELGQPSIWKINFKVGKYLLFGKLDPMIDTNLRKYILLYRVISVTTIVLGVALLIAVLFLF